MKDLTVLLLAGGDSSRFWPLADKHSLFFLGKSLGFWSLFQLNKFGFREIVIIVNQQNESLFSKLQKEFPGLQLKLVRQENLEGMAGAVLSSKNYILGKRLLIISPSDVFEDILFADFQKLLKEDPDGIIAGTTLENYFPGGYLTVKNGYVNNIVEKPLPSAVPSNIVNFVFDYFKKADLFLEKINKVKTVKDDRYEQALNLLIKEGLSIRFLSYRGFWGYLKYPWHALEINSYYLNKIKEPKTKNAVISKSAVISGNVFIEDQVRILENAKIIGPAYIGRGTIIGNNSIVRESMIGENCVVGYSTEIARSYTGDNCWFHTNYIGDSVISANVSMGAGTVLANYRLDEKMIKSAVIGKELETGKVKLGAMIGPNTRIGVNSSIMPGIKIGKNCLVGAGLILDQDLEDNKLCFFQAGTNIIKENKSLIGETERKKQRDILKLS